MLHPCPNPTTIITPLSPMQEPVSQLQALAHWPCWEIVTQIARQHGLAPIIARELLPEYQRFLSLFVASPTGYSLGMFSEEISLIWQAHICSTLFYQQLCRDVLGQFVHCIPITAALNLAPPTAMSFTRFRDAYRDMHHIEPDMSLWSLTAPISIALT